MQRKADRAERSWRSRVARWQAQKRRAKLQTANIEWTHSSSCSGRRFRVARQASKERQHGVNERLRLVNVDGVARSRDHYLFRTGDFCGHVIRGGEKRGVVGADHYQ